MEELVWKILTQQQHQQKNAITEVYNNVCISLSLYLLYMKKKKKKFYDYILNTLDDFGALSPADMVSKIDRKGFCCYILLKKKSYHWEILLISLNA